MRTGLHGSGKASLEPNYFPISRYIPPISAQSNRALSASSNRRPHEQVETGTRILLSKVGYHAAVVVSAVTLIALTIYPLPFCIDCEFPDPWGHVAVPGEVPVSVWLLTAPFLAGLFALRRGWLVPVCVVLAFLVTQPLGGVAWWSLRENEGPIIIVLRLPITAACFGIGYVVRMIVVFTKGIIDAHAL